MAFVKILGDRLALEETAMRLFKTIPICLLSTFSALQFGVSQELDVVPSISFTLADGSSVGGVFQLMSVDLPPDSLRLMQMSRIQDELELVDDQRKKLAAEIQRLNESYLKTEQELHNKLKESPKLEDELQKLRDEHRKAIEKAAEEILLPFQVERLKQIRLQAEIRNSGARGIDSEAFADWLKLTDEQKEELKTKSAEMEEKLQREIKELKAKRYREVLEDVLTKPQLKLLDERLGKPLPEIAKNSGAE